MRIINQSRDASYEFESSSLFVDDNKLYLRNNYGNSNNGLIGVYEDKTETKKVFNMIHDVFENGCKVCFAPAKGMV